MAKDRSSRFSYSSDHGQSRSCPPWGFAATPDLRGDFLLGALSSELIALSETAAVCCDPTVLQ